MNVNKEKMNVDANVKKLMKECKDAIIRESIMIFLAFLVFWKFDIINTRMLIILVFTCICSYIYLHFSIRKRMEK